jgi:hypothetical protein
MSVELVNVSRSVDGVAAIRDVTLKAEGLSRTRYGALVPRRRAGT